MCRLLLMIFFICGCTLGLNTSLYLEKWEEYKVKFGKEYKTEQEDHYRFIIFVESLQRIEEHNKRYEQGLETYKKGVNQFTAMTKEEFRRFLGSKEMAVLHDELLQGAQVYEPNPNLTVPDSLDYRTVGAVNAVRNQGEECGSCWAFSAVCTTEGAYFLKNKKSIELSEQNLVDCATPYGNHGCDGGNPILAYKYIVDNGLQSRAAYPYTGTDDPCKKGTVVAKISKYGVVKKNDEEALKAALAENGPVSVLIDADNLDDYIGGIYSSTAPVTLNHGVVAVGYGTEKGEDYWIIRNSWGPGWGEKGYMRLARNKGNQLGVATSCSYPIM